MPLPKSKSKPPRPHRNVLFRLRQTLDRLGVSEAELARRTKIDPSKVNQWARGVAFPNWANACRVADALGVALDCFRG